MTKHRRIVGLVAIALLAAAASASTTRSSSSSSSIASDVNSARLQQSRFAADPSHVDGNLQGEITQEGPSGTKRL